MNSILFNYAKIRSLEFVVCDFYTHLLLITVMCVRWAIQLLR